MSDAVPGSRPLTLDQFLKLEGLADTGGMAKQVIQAGEVELNDVVETRRGKKLQIGDRVRFAGVEKVVGPEWFSPREEN